MTEVLVFLLLTTVFLVYWVAIYITMNRFVQQQLPEDKKQLPTNMDWASTFSSKFNRVEPNNFEVSTQNSIDLR